MNKLLIVSVFCLLCLDYATKSFAQPIDAKQLITNPDFSMVQISPDGAYITSYYRNDEGRYILVINTESREIINRIQIDGDYWLQTYQWISNNQLMWK